MSVVLNIETTAKNAKNASYKLASLDTEIKNRALEAIALNIEKNKEKIIAANELDLNEAQNMVEKGNLSTSLYSRLKLDEDKIKIMIQGIYDVAKLEDPVNKIIGAVELDQDLELYKVSCPLGVIGVIFESRPDVVPQIVALAVKSSNAVLLKGGIEAFNTNKILIEVITEALNFIPEFPKNAINLLKTREDVAEMLKMDKFIDLIIPRGGNSLVKYIQENTKIPVLGHADGICHIYTDEMADLAKSIKITLDSKIQYPSACNAVETILVHENIAKNYLPCLIRELREKEVTVKGDKTVQDLVSNIITATEDDWKTEYSDKTVSIKVVKDIYEAIEHINNYGSGHTDCIITENKENIEIFMNLVDSAGVYHNVSTRFADGFRYGLGAEVGISTNKTHARGPVGLEGLVIYKYKLFGNGQTVSEYSGYAGKKFKHTKIK